MQVTANLNSGRLVPVFESESDTDLFEQLAHFQEVFDHERCGKCGNENLKFVVRRVTTKKNKLAKYYELRCTNMKCRAKLEFGVHQDTGNTLFPKTKDEDGYRPDGGWIAWDNERKQNV